MKNIEILGQVQDIFRDVFEKEDLVIDESVTAKDIDEWDSLTHIQLIVSIEKYFKIKFKATEIGEFNNVGDIVEAVSTKLN